MDFWELKGMAFDVFGLRDHVVREYREYVESFVHIRDQRSEFSAFGIADGSTEGLGFGLASPSSCSRLR